MLIYEIKTLFCFGVRVLFHRLGGQTWLGREYVPFGSSSGLLRCTTVDVESAMNASLDGFALCSSVVDGAVEVAVVAVVAVVSLIALVALVALVEEDEDEEEEEEEEEVAAAKDLFPFETGITTLGISSVERIAALLLLEMNSRFENPCGWLRK